MLTIQQNHVGKEFFQLQSIPPFTGIFANGKNMRTADILPFEYFAIYGTQYMHTTESSHGTFKELFFVRQMLVILHGLKIEAVNC